MESMDSRSEPVHRRRIDNTTLVVIALLAVALLWRLVFFLEMYASPYGNSLTLDSLVYDEIAREVAAGGWSPGTAFFQAPLYTWVLGMVYAVFGSGQTVAKLLQIFMSVASCWLIYRVAGRTFDRTVATVALAIGATYGMYLYFANELLVVTMIVFLDLLGIDLLQRATEGGRKVLWGAAGAVFGLSAIARPTVLPFVAAVCLWIIVTDRRSGKMAPALRNCAFFALGVALPIAPVTLHNFIADGDLVLIAANGGLNFYIGNNPQSDGITAAAPGLRPDRGGAHSDQARAAREALGRSDATPREMSEYWYDRGWQHIKNDPGWAMRHTVYKAFVLINAHEVSNNRVIEFVTRHSSIFTWASLKLWLVLPLAIAGVAIGGGRSHQKSILLIFVAVYSATIIPFFISARFRLPVVAVLMVFAAAAVVGWSRKLRLQPPDRRAVASVFVALLVAILVRPLPGLRVSDAQAFFNEAEAYRSHDDYASASIWYRAALDEFPSYCDAANNLARIYTDVFPDPQHVIEILEPVVGACAEDTGIRLLIGHALCAVGRCDEGRTYLGRAEEGISGSEAS
jgi:4-amino-4-deoxy-L-arabinose transferase-like glycosyltransferase